VSGAALYIQTKGGEAEPQWRFGLAVWKYLSSAVSLQHFGIFPSHIWVFFLFLVFFRLFKMDILIFFIFILFNLIFPFPILKI
jgi:hypothetical protein